MTDRNINIIKKKKNGWHIGSVSETQTVSATDFDTPTKCVCDDTTPTFNKGSEAQ